MVKSVVEIEGGTLEDKYNALNRELERSENRARDIHDRVKSVKDVADDLFKEWEKELGSTRIDNCGPRASATCVKRSAGHRP